MLKLLILLLLPAACFGQITSYTATQTGAGNAEIYWPEGATHAVVFIPGSGERSTPAQLYAYNSPINWVKNGARPSYAVVAFSPGAYSFVSVNNASYLRVVRFMKWLKSIHPEWKTFSPTGLSYGAADWYNYIKYAAEADYMEPYSAFLMSITSEAQGPSYNSLAKTDTRFSGIRLWAQSSRNDSHHDKMKKYTTLMINAGYPAKWETITATNPAHCCWDVQYSRKDVQEWLAGPVVAEPALTISAGPDTTIYWPQDSLIIRTTVTGVPAGALYDVRASVVDGFGLVDGMVVKRLYKDSVTIEVNVFYNGKRATDVMVIKAVYDPSGVFKRFKLGDLNMVILNDGRMMQEF